jgi:hypothetical protein
MARRFFTRQFDPSMQDYLRGTQFAREQARQVGKDIGTIGGTLYDTYRDAKMKQIMSEAFEDWDYFQKEKEEEEKYQQALKDTGYVTEEGRELDEDIVVPDMPTIFDKKKVFGPEEEVDLPSGTEFQILPDASTKLTGARRFDVSEEVPIEPGEEFQITEEGDLYFPAPEEEVEPLTEVDFRGEDERTPEEQARFERASSYFQPGMTDAEKFRRVAALVAPYDMDKSREMLKYADQREREERKFEQEKELKLEQERIRAGELEDKAKVTQMIRAEQAWDGSRSKTNQLTQQYNQLLSSRRFSDAAGVKKDLDKWSKISEQQYKKLSKMDPEKYPDFDKIEIEDEVPNLANTGDKNRDEELKRIALDSVDSSGELDVEKIMSVTDPTERAAVEAMAKNVQNIKRDEINFKKEQQLKNLELQARYEGTEGEKKTSQFFETAVEQIPNLKPISRAEYNSLVGTGFETVDKLLKFSQQNMSTQMNAASIIIANILRKESGAAIGKDELASEIQRYIPIEGDSAQTIKNKQSALNTKLKGLLRGSTRDVKSKYGAQFGLGGKPKKEKRKAGW